MSFDRRDIRPGMDVFTLDGVYLGVVLAVEAETADGRRWSNSNDAPPLPASAVSGELLGPEPTTRMGNRGPAGQGAAAQYGSTSDDAAPLSAAMLHVGHWPGLWGVRRVPLADVQMVAMERVVLRLNGAEIERG